MEIVFGCCGGAGTGVNVIGSGEVVTGGDLGKMGDFTIACSAGASLIIGITGGGVIIFFMGGGLSAVGWGVGGLGSGILLSVIKLTVTSFGYAALVF